MTAKLARFLTLFGVVAVSAAIAGCGEFVRDGKSPARLVITSLQGSSGADPGEIGTVVHSDVVTLVTTGGACTINTPCLTTFSDPGLVELQLQLRDIGNPASPSTPSQLNAVTISRYHVEYRRSDGRNTPGVDVPYAFDGAATFTVPATGSATGGFSLVRGAAKLEAPLTSLVADSTLITTIAYVTFYGRDQAGNDVSVMGTIEVTFANFADPA